MIITIDSDEFVLVIRGDPANRKADITCAIMSAHVTSLILLFRVTRTFCLPERPIWLLRPTLGVSDTPDNTIDLV